MLAADNPDYAIQLLAQRYGENSGNRVWVADENWSGAESGPGAGIRFDEATLIVTNRIDISRSHTALPDPPLVELSDFVFHKAVSGEVDALFYRVSKEKPLVHHVINCSARLLRQGGSLYLTGHKDEGTKTYYEKAKLQLGAAGATWKKAKHGAYCGHLIKSFAAESSTTAAPLPCQDYPDLRPVTEVAEARFYSKPGIFGWDKIDQGSALVIEELPRFIQELEQPPTGLLDLGCGFGYLAVMAGKRLKIPITATDNNVAAIAACEHNMKTNAVPGSVVLDDCGRDIDSQFDVILCNPPFHRGFSTSSQLTQGFLENCRRLLAPGGAALFVVSKFIPLETLAAPYFTAVDRVGTDGSFKLVRLRA